MSQITAKGQVTIPKHVRQKMGLRPGDEVEFVEHKGQFYVEKRVDLDSLRAAIRKYSGYLKDLTGRDPDELVDEMRGPRLSEIVFEAEEEEVEQPTAKGTA